MTNLTQTARELLDIAAAMREAFALGQTYWQQADSEYASQWRKSDETKAKFDQLLADTESALARAVPEAKPVVIEAVAAIQRNSDGDLFVDWLLEGGIHGLENGDVLMVSATDLTNDEGYGEVYLSTPTPAPPAMGEPIAWAATDYQADGPNTQYTSDPYAAEYYASIGLDVRPLYGSTTPQPQAAAGVDGLRELIVQWRHNAQGCTRREAHAAGTWRSCARELEAALIAAPNEGA